MGANVIVTEVDPTRALEAVMDGYRVMPSIEAAALGDIFLTVTGDINVIDRAHLERMKHGALIANSGHFNDEINIQALEPLALHNRHVHHSVDDHTYPHRLPLHFHSDHLLPNS